MMHGSCGMGVRVKHAKQTAGHGLLMLAFVFLAGCTNRGELRTAHEEKALADVVDAVQFAVDIAAKDKVWNATSKEADHWAQACEVASKTSADSCHGMIEKAQPMCQGDCPNGQCNLVAQRRCESYVSGAAFGVMCSQAKKTGVAVDTWCNAAEACISARTSAAGICASSELVRLPQLVEATLTLAVERTTSRDAGLNILIVSFNTGRSESSANSISMVLKPRTRSIDYGTVDLPMDFPPERTVSKEAQALATQLSTLITDAVKASVKEYDMLPNGTTTVARAPMLMAELEVSFSLTVDSNGSLGIKKAWGGIGAELGGEYGTKRVNTLSIRYARK
jgi:hypothetical protein